MPDFFTPQVLTGIALGFLLGVSVSFILARTGVWFFSNKLKEISRQTLSEQGAWFLENAQNHFSGYLDQARRDLDHQGQKIQQTMDPVQQSLHRYEERLRAMEADRQRANGAIAQSLRQMGQTQQLLQLETANLVKALRVPHVRGRWGEITLRRAAELSGMVSHCDFVEQMTDGTTGKGSLRPDMVITLPGDRKIVVDSKVPLMAYLDALEARDEAEQKARMVDHARQVATHMRQLASKKYTQAFTPTPEFVVLFVPGENFFSAALTHQPDLVDRGVEQGVILATPTTLIALLKTVAYAWQQQRSHENAREIRELGAQLYQRLSSMGDNLGRLGRDIERCAASFNKTVGAVESRVMVPARKLNDLGVSAKEIPEITPLDPGQTRVRTLKNGDSNETRTG